MILVQRILYDATIVKVCQAFYAICDYAELEKEWADALWLDILSEKQVYEELVYYMNHHTFLDRVKACGYSLCDLYVWQMNRYNLIKDTGKNSRTCNKEKMAMQAFRTMMDMLKNPERYKNGLDYGRGTDKF